MKLQSNGEPANELPSFRSHLRAGPFSRLTWLLTARLAMAADWFDRRLPGRYRGWIAKAFGRKDQRHIHPRFAGREDFFRNAHARGLHFATLAGYGDIEIDGNARLAVLFSDGDVDAARDLVTPWPVGEPIEVYSPSGLSGFAFGDMPILPPALANRLLEIPTDSGTIHLLPAKERFLFAAYRDVYLGGTDAGIGSENAEKPPRSQSSREMSLNAAGRALGLAVEQPVTLEGLDRLLQQNGWQPPVEFLERIGCWNPWVAEKLRRQGEWAGSEKPGLAVFFLRKRAMELGLTEKVLDTLSGKGFSLHPLTELTAEQMAEVAREARGGNWGRGPFPVSGGEPGLVIVAIDREPIASDSKTLKQFPLLDNQRIQLAKQAVRKLVQAGVPRRQRYNGMHSTDNSVQAWRTVRALCPELEKNIRESLN